MASPSREELPLSWQPSRPQHWAGWAGLTAAVCADILGAEAVSAEAVGADPVSAEAGDIALLSSMQVIEATIPDLNEAFEAGTLTSEQLVQFYLDRIDAYDQQGPAINSLITINPEAIAQAQALDQERQMSGPRSVLHGIPIILKDNYNTADLPTTAGSVALEGSISPADAFVVRQLREAGAIVLGKANMSEFALSYGRLGYSSLGGLTLNPLSP
ncbi:MAG: hypothetical protein KME20_11490 [Kaiparowitsia implicata GSE-PSE-MK54-09C]|nr:hypothetical protein [Kaiparowitsia implicata GSE-PSE-MK54-09C]